MSLLVQAEGFRAKAPHALNKFSSRSHSIVAFRVKHARGDVKLYLVDLAGSERAEKANTTGETFKEGLAERTHRLVQYGRCY